MAAQQFHLAEHIEEEMATRGWSLDDLAFRMCGVDPKEWAITRLAIEMYLAVREKDIVLGEDMANQLSRALGPSPQFFTNLHESWRAAQ